MTSFNIDIYHVISFYNVVKLNGSQAKSEKIIIVKKL